MRNPIGEPISLASHTHRPHPDRQIPRRIPGRFLIPFLLFWSVGSFALGAESSRLPLAAFASAIAIVRPAHLIASAPGQLAPQVTIPQSDSRIHLVATGILGDKPSAARQHGSGRRTHRTSRATAHISPSAAHGFDAQTHPYAASPWGYADDFTLGWPTPVRYVNESWAVRIPVQIPVQARWVGPSTWGAWGMSGRWQSTWPTNDED